MNSLCQHPLNLILALVIRAQELWLRETVIVVPSLNSFISTNSVMKIFHLSWAYVQQLLQSDWYCNYCSVDTKLDEP